MYTIDMAHSEESIKWLHDMILESEQLSIPDGYLEFMLDMKWAEEDLKKRAPKRFLNCFKRLRGMNVRPDLGGRPTGQASRWKSHLKRKLDATVVLPQGEGADDLRAAYISHQIARIASTRAEVQACRLQLLGSPEAVLTDDEAVALLASPAAWLLPAAEVMERGVPLHAHAAEYSVNPSGIDSGQDSKEITVKLTWGEKHWDSTRKVWPDRDGLSLEIDSPDRGPIFYLRDSHLHALARAAREIASGYSWSESSAAWFILTGAYTVHRAIEVHTDFRMGSREFELAFVGLRVQPFVSPQTVMRLYKEIQQRIQGHRSGPPIQESNLALMNFVAGKELTAGGRPSWPTLMAEWNQLATSQWGHEEWVYEDFRHMRRDFESTRMRVLKPSYKVQFPGWKREERKLHPLREIYRYRVIEGAPSELAGCALCGKTSTCVPYSITEPDERAFPGMLVCERCHENQQELALSPEQIHLGEAKSAFTFVPEDSARRVTTGRRAKKGGRVPHGQRRKARPGG